MMSLSKKAINHQPKKPLNAYFVFKAERLALYKDEKHKNQKVQQDWENIDAKLKLQMESKYKEQLAKYKVDYENWVEEYNVPVSDNSKVKRQKSAQVYGMSLSKEAVDNKPKKPANAYFTFRAEKLALYKDDENRIQKAQQDWASIHPKLKKQMESKYHEQLAKYKVDYENWAKKYNVLLNDNKNFKLVPKESKVEKQKGMQVKGVSLSKEAIEHRPKKPINAYFTFRTEKSVLYKDVKDKDKKIKYDWENIDLKLKQEMESKYHEQLAKYKIDYKNWAKEYNVPVNESQSPKSVPKESKVEKQKGTQARDISLSKEAVENRPTKPLNAYLKFRMQMLTFYKDAWEDRAKKIKYDWENIDPRLKQEMELHYKEQLAKYKVDYELWVKKYNVSGHDSKVEKQTSAQGDGKNDREEEEEEEETTEKKEEQKQKEKEMMGEKEKEQL